MIITIKKLEFIFAIVYFFLASGCLLISYECFIATTASTAVGLGDWILLKFMAKKWLKRGKYSFLDSMIRFSLIAISILFLLKLHLNKIGIIVGVSVVPISLMITAVMSVFSKKTSL